MSQDPALESELSESCLRAFGHLQDRRPEAEIIAIDGDWGYFSFGHIRVIDVTDTFEQEEALGIARVPTNFPCNTDPYGLLTVPALDRKDGQPIDSQDRSHQRAQPVIDALGTDDVGFWSWQWERISSTEETDLKKAPDMLRERLQMEG